ncbi:MAG: hypothetical protein LBP28_09285, partial [Coriobacteriales bacterium]|nr:hypothetical protein [Coriobacteriales bacterium]
MNITDIHCHIYPDPIASKAAENVGTFYGVKMKSPGSVSELLRRSKPAQISKHVVHSVALRPKNVISINDFIAEQAAAHPEFVGFATMHHDFVEKEAEIARAIALGLKGFKL